MAKAVSLTILPLEVLEEIVSYLSAADLAHCLGVNLTWYNIFSSDFFWRKHCKPNLSNYLSKTKCLVEPAFKLPKDTPLPVAGKRLDFLQEQHLWQNWDAGRYKKQEIELDFEDPLLCLYGVEVSFFDNEHLLLHTALKTEVWNVADNPTCIITIPHCLNKMYDYNLYKIIENYLVVIQSNVVQMYKISLDLKSWSVFKIFFYNKPEDFSSKITAETDVDAMVLAEFERVICGQYLVGALLDEYNEFLFLHVWDLKTGNKVKEEKCEICVGIYSIELKSSQEVTDKVLVTYVLKNHPGPPKRSSIIYDLVQMQYIMPTRRDHLRQVLYFDGCLSVVDDYLLNIFYHLNPSTHNEENVESTYICDLLSGVLSIEPLGSNLLISTRNDVYLIDPSEKLIENLERFFFTNVYYKVDIVNVLCNRYILLHSEHSLKEIWKAEKSLEKILEFPSDFGTYLASNDACSKIVLKFVNKQQGYKLIVLTFW